MAQYALVEEKIDIPEDVEVDLDTQKSIVVVKGPKGTLERDFSHAPVSIEMKDNSVTVFAYFPRKKEKALVGTIASHIRNMIKGTTEGFVYKMKIVYSHFPISVEVQDTKKEVLIKNFIGERAPRRVKIVGDNTTVRTEGKEDLIVEGIDVEAVGQTSANIQQATRIRKKDIRIFLDGIYVAERIK